MATRNGKSENEPNNLSNMNVFLTSNFIRAEDLNEIIETTIIEVYTQSFPQKNGRSITRPVLYLEDERAVVCNRARLQTMIDAFGENASNWIGRSIKIWRGQTYYEGRKVASMEIGPILPRSIEDQRTIT